MSLPHIAEPTLLARAPANLPDCLPPLREGLRLVSSVGRGDGTPGWSIDDPLHERALQIGWLEFELLLRWSLGTPDTVLRAMRAQTQLDVTPEELSALLGFLREHGLLRRGDRALPSSAAPRALRSWQSGCAALSGRAFWSGVLAAALIALVLLGLVVVGGRDAWLAVAGQFAVTQFAGVLR